MRSFLQGEVVAVDPVAEVGLGVQHLARLGNDVAGDFQRNRDHAIGIGVNQITGLHPYPAHFDWHLGFEKAEVAMGRYHARCEVVETHLANGVQVAYPAVRDETDRSQSLRHRRQAVAEMAAVVWPGSNVLQHQHHGLRGVVDRFEAPQARFLVVDARMGGRVKGRGYRVSDHDAELGEHAANVPAHEAVGVAAHLEGLNGVGYSRRVDLS